MILKTWTNILSLCMTFISVMEEVTNKIIGSTRKHTSALMFQTSIATANSLRLDGSAKVQQAVTEVVPMDGSSRATQTHYYLVFPKLVLDHNLRTQPTHGLHL